jgi:hypothetical protein
MLRRIICVAAALALAMTVACKRSGGVATGPSPSRPTPAPATPAAPAIAPTESARPAGRQGYVMVCTAERPGEPTVAARTYLLDRYVLTYNGDNKLVLLFDLEDESWLPRSGRKVTLAYAEGFVERVNKAAERKWKQRGRDAALLQETLRPTFTVTEAEGRLTFRNKVDTFEVTPVSPQLPADLADRVHRYTRMENYALAVGGDYHLYDDQAVAEQLRERSICPAAIDRRTARPGSPPTRLRRTFSFEPLSPDQCVRLQDLARQFEAQALSGALD